MEKNYPMESVDKIKAYLEENGIMRRWLAKKIYITDPYLSLVLSGERRLTENLRERIEEILKVKI